MKKSFKIEATLINKVRRHVKKTKQTIGGFIEAATEASLESRTDTLDNCDAFREYLRSREIEFRGNGHYTTVLGVQDPIQLGISYAIYRERAMKKIKS